MATIDRSRVSRLLTSEFLRFERAAGGLRHVASIEAYRLAFDDSLAALGVPYLDRALIALGSVANWVESRRFAGVTTLLEWERARSLAISAQLMADVNVITSGFAALRHLSRQLPGAARGHYLFAHVMAPHFGYAFDASCSLRSAREIVSSEFTAAWRRPRHLLDGPTERAIRDRIYRDYFAQIACTQRRVFELLDAIDANPRLRDATIILHGDHGSRINFASPDRWEAIGGPRGAFERDWRAAFMAVRAPGMTPGRIERTALITEVFQHLVANDFHGMDPAALVHQDFVMQGP